MNMADWAGRPGWRQSTLAVLAAAALLTVSAAYAATLEKQVFGKAQDGTVVDTYTLSNAKGMQAQVLTYGGVVHSLKVPDRDGRLDNVVLGFAGIDHYLENTGTYFGAL